MMNFFLTPADIKYNNTNHIKTLQTKLPQNVVSDKETFNDRTRKSLLKINLFIKRLKWFNIFTTAAATEETTIASIEAESKTANNQQSSKVQEAIEQQQREQQKW